MEMGCLNRLMMVGESIYGGPSLHSLRRRVVVRHDQRSRRTWRRRRRWETLQLPANRSRFCASSSRSSSSKFQDFGGFAQPLFLLPAEEANICPCSSAESPSKVGLDESHSLYSVQLHTSSYLNSGLDVSASLLICLIGENGDSILQRILSMPSVNSNRLEEMDTADRVCFQRGSVDHLTFRGPQLSKLQALWVGVDSGSWRFRGVSLAVTSPKESQSSSEEESSNLCGGIRYEFGDMDIFLGETEEMTMVELRPCHISELSSVNPFDLSSIHLPISSALPESKISLEDGLREYRDLKLSMLLYDLVLVLGGTYIMFTLPTGDRTASNFLIGGGCGFLYLFLLQRTVDRICASSSVMNGNSPFGLESLWRMLLKAKEPLPVLAVGLVSTFLALKYFLVNNSMLLTPQELFALASGFFICKLAVVLAAFRPISSSSKAK
ncbi:uncharacterized protein LOC116246259 [Nymphaea colorata]|nr:uncharacterized protein LOC116246259 [Nymphaea colorata]